MVNKFKVNHVHDAVICSFISFMWGFNIVLTIFLIVDPLGVLLVGSIIPANYLFFGCKQFLVLLNAYILSCLISSCIIFGQFVWMYVYYVVWFYTTEIRLDIPVYKHKSHSGLRDNPENLRHVFVAFRVLHQHVICVFGPYILICNATFMISSIYISFVLLKYFSDLKLYATVPLIAGDIVVLSTWTGIMEIGMILYIRGNKVLRSWATKQWESNQENFVMQKFQRSCKPLLLSYGTQFVIRKGSLFVFYRGVIKGTFRALLTVR